MTADTENLVLEILKRIQADMGEVKRELASIHLEISAMGQAAESYTDRAWEVAA